MLALKLALDRAPQYQAQIKDWVYRQTGYHIAFAHVWPAFRWYGPELYFDRLELRSHDDRRVLARAARRADRVRISGSCCRTANCSHCASSSTRPISSSSAWVPSRFALASEIVLGQASELRCRKSP